MKKTLIALAAVAVSTGAMAQAHNQATISGNFNYGFESVSSQANSANAAKVKSSGLRAMDGNINFRATEDLGGGLSATVAMTIETQGRDSDVKSKNASLTLSGGFGSILVGAIEAGNGIVGLGGAGAPVRGLNNPYNTATGRLLAPAGTVDIIQYTSPAFNGLTVRANMTDKTGAGGQESASLFRTSSTVGVRYAAGPLTVDADFTTTSRKSAALPSTVTSNTKDRTRMSASYNLGVARIGAGIEKRTVALSATTERKETDTIIGLSAPVGSNITVGVTRGTADNFKGVANSKKGSGTEFGIKYDFSKRTSLTAQTGSFKASTEGAIQNKQSITRVVLAHSF